MAWSPEMDAFDERVAVEVMGWHRGLDGMGKESWFDAGGQLTENVGDWRPSSDQRCALAVMAKLSERAIFTVYRGLGGPFIAMNGKSVDDAAVVEMHDEFSMAVSLAALRIAREAREWELPR